jgi:hypothetical protein
LESNLLERPGDAGYHDEHKFIPLAPFWLVVLRRFFRRVPMIRRLTLAELIDTAQNLESSEKLALVAAIRERLAQGGDDRASRSALGAKSPADDWMDAAFESLARSYGQSEPEYSEKDLMP